MKITELKKLCKERKIKGYSKLKKKSLIELLKLNENKNQKNKIMYKESYCIPLITKPKYNVLKNYNLGKSINWMQVEGVPCKIIKKTEHYIYLNSFSSVNNKSKFRVTYEEFENDFKEAKVEDEKIITEKYGLLDINEFKERENLNNFRKSINTFIKKLNYPGIKKILEDKINQLMVSQGCTKTIKIDNYNKFDSNLLKKHERIGDPIFNRSVRWCPPIPNNFTYEDFTKTLSYPAPIGIRKKDFALPSTMIKTIITLLNQIFNMKNVKLDEELKNKFSNIINKYNYKLEISEHKCKFCNQSIDINEYTSSYKSCENYIEICHRNPNSNFNEDNIYWGHGLCNRKQGGYTELECIENIFGILENKDYDKDYINDIINRLIILKNKK